MYINFTSMEYYLVYNADAWLFRKRSADNLHKYLVGRQVGTYLFITSIGNCSFILSTTQSCK